MEPPTQSHPPQPPPPRTPPSPTLIPSLPEDIVLSILARISTSYYPRLSFVSKGFRSLIPSKDLKLARFHHKTLEHRVYVCLQSDMHPCDHRWFSLWIKPDDHQTLKHHCDGRWVGFWVNPDNEEHQTLACCMSEDKTTGNLLVPIPSSYTPDLPMCCETIGSDIYEIGGGRNPSSSTTVRVCNELVGKWRKAPSMMVARKNAFTCSLDGKVYVMGGCEAEESACWAEVFDPITQTWEPLPDPGSELRFSSIKNLSVHPGRIYVRSKKKNFVYLIEENKWEVVEENIGESECEIDNIRYCYANDKCWWHDPKYSKEWRLVKGLTELDRHFRIGRGMEIVSYGRKLVIFWVGPAEWLEDFPLSYMPSEIWCAVILLERRNDGEVWGQTEWVDPVLRVPRARTLLRCVELMQ